MRIQKMGWSALAVLLCFFGAGSVAPPAVAAERDITGVIDEIVVTSRRRQESQQDVPLSVTAFGAEQIEQLKPQTLRDFDGLAPNIYLGMNTAGPSASALYIRGIGYPDIEKTQTPQVGVIVDGIQMGSSTGQLIDTFDVESIEINRGPQGVFFGKNTSGGNIVVNRVRPQFNEFGLKVSGEFGNYDLTNFKGRVNIPLIDDTLALKVGAIFRERDGFYDNETLGGTAADIDFQSQTAALRWAPSETFEAILTYDRLSDNGQIPAQDPRVDGSDPFENRANKREPMWYDVDQLGLRMDWELGGGWVLNSVTGWHDSRDKVNQDFDGTDFGTAVPFAQLHTLRTQEFEVFTQELRVSGDITDTLELMVGVFYYDSEQDFTQRTSNIIQLPPAAFPLPPGPCVAFGLAPNPTAGDAICMIPNARSTQIAGEEVESVAFFGALTWRPTERLEFTAGLRYIDEEKEAFNSYFDHSDGTFDTTISGEFDFTGFPTTAGVSYSVGDDWDDVIAQASASWAITDNNRAYVSYSEGFRSGGMSIRSARDPAEAPFDPEEAWQFEIGLKNEFLDRRLRANIAYFMLEQEDSQFSSIIPLPPNSIPGTTTLINNANKTEIDGVEIEVQWLATDSLTVSLNGGYIDVENDDFSIACEFIDGCATAVPGVLDPPGTLREFGSTDLSRQPEWTISTSLDYVTQVGNGTLFAHAGYKTVGEFLLVQTGGAANQQLFGGNYYQVDARIGYEWQLAGESTLEISAFGKNLTDEEFLEQALFLGGFNTGFQGWGAPRTYAVELIYTM